MIYPLPFQLSQESESVVKTYECVKIKKLFLGQCNGYLTLTNKRIIYHVQTKKQKSLFTIQKEMPLVDVSSISSSIISSINWVIALFFALGVSILASIYKSIMPQYLYHWLIGVIVVIPYVLIWLANKNILNPDIAAYLTGKHSEEGSTINKLSTYLSDIWCYIFLFGLFILGINVFSNNLTIMMFILFVFAYLFVFKAKPSFSLLIFSKTSKGPGIMISGIQTFNLFGQTNANDSVTGVPGEDAELLVRELGAIVADLTQIGDFSINKWKRV